MTSRKANSKRLFCCIHLLNTVVYEFVFCTSFDFSTNAPSHSFPISISVVLIAWVNCYSVELAARVQVIFTVAKIVALVVIIIGGFVKLGQGEFEVLGNILSNVYSSIMAAIQSKKRKQQIFNRSTVVMEG